MRHAPIPLALAAWAVATLAGAQLSKEFKEWPESPAGFLLTKAERKAYGELKTDAEAKAWIELFWAKRDPDLETVVNEFKADFDARVEAADKTFSFGQSKGSLSDRGRVLLLLGKYSQRRTHGPGEQGVLDRGAVDEATGGGEVWKYLGADVPKWMKVDELTFVFTETRTGAGDFLLDRADRRVTMGMKALTQAPDALLLHPKLTEVPRVGLLPGSKAATAADLAVLAAPERPWPDGSLVRTAPGVATESVHPLWIYVELPVATPLATRAVGRVTSSATGEEKGTFIASLKSVSVASGNAYEFALPVDAGSWKVEIALLADSGPVAVTTQDVTTPEVPREGTVFSPFFWGVDIRQEAQAHLGDPFNVGGWHVLPRTNDAYQPSEQLAYFCFVIRPGIAEAAPAGDQAAPAGPPRPKLELALTLFKDGRKISDLPASPVNVSQITGNLWMFGNGLPLSVFEKKDGDYRLDLTLRDTVSNATATASIPMKVVTPAAPAAPPSGS